MSDDLQIEAYTSLEQLEQLRPIWGSLSFHLETDLDFFLRVVAVRPEFIAPCVLVAKRNGTPVAMLVGRLEKVTLRSRIVCVPLPGLSVRQFVFVCFGCKDLSAPIAELLVRHIIELLKAHVADRAVLSHCIRGSPLHTGVRGLPNPVMRDYFPDVRARWRLLLPDSYEKFLQDMNSRKRTRLRYCIHRIEKAFRSEWNVRIFSRPGETDQFFAAAERIASKSWQRDLGKGFLNSEEEHRRIITNADNGWWRAYILYIKDRPVAFWTGEFYRKEFSLLYTAFDPEYRIYRVGLALLLKLIEDMCGLHARLIDFGVGTQYYKELLGNDFHLEAEVTLHAPSARGILANVLGSATAFLNNALVVLMHRIGLQKLDPGWKAHRDFKSLHQLQSIEKDYASGNN